MNLAIMIGNLTDNPVKVENADIVKFTIAHNSKYTTKEGEIKDEVCYMEVVVFNKLGESIMKYLTKGSKVAVNGRLKYSTWDKEGQKQSKHSIVLDDITFLTPKKNDKEEGHNE